MTGLSCDGCGAIGQTGSVLPVGWFRILVKARREESAGHSRVIETLDVCSMKCAPKALKTAQKIS